MRTREDAKIGWTVVAVMVVLLSGAIFAGLTAHNPASDDVISVVY